MDWVSEGRIRRGLLTKQVGLVNTDNVEKLASEGTKIN